MSPKRKRKLDKVYLHRRIALGVALVGVVAFVGYGANWIRQAVAAPQNPHVSSFVSSSTPENASVAKPSSSTSQQSSSSSSKVSEGSSSSASSPASLPESSSSASSIPVSSKSESSPSSLATVQADDWRLMLVNPWVPIPDDFKVDLVDYGYGYMIDKRMQEELKTMLSDAYTAGHRIYICSAFRTQEFQQKLFDNQVTKMKQSGYSQEEALVEAAKWVAVPGTSEHQLGLAVDVLAVGYEYLDNTQPDLPHYKWLKENSYKYGFILRYAQDKTKETGIVFEPWHYRYVGKEVAKELYDSGECLEEYLERIKK